MEEVSKFDAAKFNAYKALADYWASSYERRRSVEWKLSLGLWAVILTGFTKADDLHHMFGALLLGVWSLLMLLGYVGLWLYPIQIKNWRDQRISYYFASLARKEAGVPSLGSFAASDSQKKLPDVGALVEEIEPDNPTVDRHPRRWLMNYWSLSFHLVTTFLLLAALNITAWRR